MEVRDIMLNGSKTAAGVEIPLPHAPLVLAIGRRGFVMCGYLNMETAEKMGDCAAMVRGVKTVDELLSGVVVEVTSAARKLGVRKKMTGARALSRMA